MTTEIKHSFNCCFHLSYIELYWQAKVAWADAVTNCDTWCLKKTEKLCHWLSQFNTTDQLEMRSGSPHPFWHQELVSWKTIFLQIGGRWSFWDDSSTLRLLCTLFLLLYQLHLLRLSGIWSQRLRTVVLEERIFSTIKSNIWHKNNNSNTLMLLCSC